MLSLDNFGRTVQAGICSLLRCEVLYITDLIYELMKQRRIPARLSSNNINMIHAEICFTCVH